MANSFISLHCHNGIAVPDDNCYYISSTIIPVGPLCLYWGDTDEAEDATICGHASCYKIIHGELDQAARDAGV